MSEVKKSEETIKELYDAADEEKKVHERNKIRLLLLIKNRLKGMVLVPQARWERIKALIDINEEKLPFNNAEDNLVWLLGRFEELKKVVVL